MLNLFLRFGFSLVRYAARDRGALSVSVSVVASLRRRAKNKPPITSGVTACIQKTGKGKPKPKESRPEPGTEVGAAKFTDV